MSFKQQIIRCRTVIVPVSLYAFFSELILKSEPNCFFEDFIIDWNPVISNDDSVREIDC